MIADPTDAAHAFASYGGFREGYTSANVYETTDGTTWQNVSGNLPNAPVNFLSYDSANDTLYAATDLGVFFMQNDVAVWTKLGDNLPNTATEDLKTQASSSSLYVGTFGRGTWRIPLVTGGGGESCTASVTNNGSITTDDGDSAKFDGNAKFDAKKSQIKGDESYEVKKKNSVEPIKIKSKDLLTTTCSLDSSPQTATVWGTATIKGSGEISFRIDVTDAGKKGTNDTYRIATSDGYDSGVQPLEKGDIKIDKD